MFAKLGNGLAGTWESLDERERMLALVSGVYVVLFLYLGLTWQGRKLSERERKREEMREFADIIAERLRG